MEEGEPSKEVGFHAVIYQQRPEVDAIVHVHSAYAIALGDFPLNALLASAVEGFPVLGGSSVLGEELPKYWPGMNPKMYLAK